jgi:hypothetical protein
MGVSVINTGNLKNEKQGSFILYLDEINCIDYGVREVYMLYAGIH